MPLRSQLRELVAARGWDIDGRARVYSTISPPSQVHWDIEGRACVYSTISSPLPGKKGHCRSSLCVL